LMAKSPSPSLLTKLSLPAFITSLSVTVGLLVVSQPLIADSSLIPAT
jgi:hypothetical protein